MMTLEYETLCGLSYPSNYIGSAFGVPEDQKLVVLLQTDLPFGNWLFSLNELHNSNSALTTAEGDPSALPLANKYRLSLQAT